MQQSRSRPGKSPIRAVRAPQLQALDRRAALGRLLPFWPHELEDESPAARRWIIARLQRALRAERRRGLAGHWTYDLARHVELLRLYRMEQALLRSDLRCNPACARDVYSRPVFASSETD